MWWRLGKDSNKCGFWYCTISTSRNKTLCTHSVPLFSTTNLQFIGLVKLLDNAALEFCLPNMASVGTPSPTATSAEPIAIPVYRENPQFPQYASQDLRQESYSQCQEVYKHPRYLAQAGFFFDDMDNCSRCFHCGIGIYSSYNIYWITSFAYYDCWRCVRVYFYPALHTY